ncbi:hypothetical protein MTo_00578 [Microcystis aeruginosa NIES-1211]|uniref:Uncharacterized protein n=1 Tax=Microcystis aeruginosa NIES-2519 TaxID=2303981 RepID=A0A5A5RIF8_MICAE|nr:hypothetical protein MTo_00578 [Microcystis aeruginosa NIES-1211]GCA72116.1 hypothetical protein MiYa_03663 [Microcystis aeruginosa NIES-2519]GCA84434.1 hypothetical protein MiHa_02405 [Microcystis aeruginosa NIES-2522]CCI31863.1 hypothetical protein MICAI_220002 [Microcystis sp. T1-4]
MVAEIVTELTAITKEPPDQLASPQILELLNQILAKLNRLSQVWWVKCILRYIPPSEGVERTTKTQRTQRSILCKLNSSHRT